MARGKKKSENPASSAAPNNDNVEQLTKGLQKLSVKEKKKKKSPEDQQKDKAPNKTPYQGKKQCFGLYECLKCKNEWASSHSWANTWQECLQCRGKVYPHRQWPKKKKGKKVGGKPHQQQYCGKCIRIGRYCGDRG